MFLAQYVLTYFGMCLLHLIVCIYAICKFAGRHKLFGMFIAMCSALLLPKLQYLNVVILLLWGRAVAQWVEAICYKPKGSGFDSPWFHWNFSLT
jgi:hypothetical protein